MTNNSNGKEKEGPTPEELELARDYAKKNLTSNLWNYAAPKFINFENYGRLSTASGALYAEAVSQVPEEHVYRTLFLPMLLNKDGSSNDSGAITNPYLQETSHGLLLRAPSHIKVSDLSELGYTGSIRDDIKDKYIHELDKKDASEIISSFYAVKTDEMADKILKLRIEASQKNLESIVGNAPTDSGQ